MAGRETEKHLGLKTLALAWAAERGMSLGAPEVSFPHRRFRVDAAACTFQREVPARPPSVNLASVLKVAVVFECKQVRSDLLHDTKERKSLTRRLQTLEIQRKDLETLLKLIIPTMRTVKACSGNSTATAWRNASTKVIQNSSVKLRSQNAD